MVPEPQRMAIHQAGDAVVLALLVGRERFAVARVTVEGAALRPILARLPQPGSRQPVRDQI